MKDFLLLFMSLLCTCVSAQTCHTPFREHAPVPASILAKTATGTLCSKVFVQVDYDIVVDKGMFGAIAYADSVMNEVAIPYADIDVELSFEYQFLESETYTQGGSLDLLQQFRANLPVFDGDVAILISYKSTGGIAWVDQVCRNSSYKYGFASVKPDFLPFRDAYSWTIEVIAHELGHLYGSPHTQDCAWNGNGTAIDGCYQSPGCDRGPIPPNGGTIMSYCHLVNGVGINFARGFHPQVAAVIRAGIFLRCEDCAIPDDDGDDPVDVTCEENELFINLILDAYPGETSYHLETAAGEVLHRSRPFLRAEVGEVITDTLCLPAGCYRFVMTDSTGLRNEGCLDGMWYIGDPFGEIASGQEFSGTAEKFFCLDAEPPEDECTTPPTAPLLIYANQHRGGSAIQVTGGVQLDSNTWRAVPFTYTTTPNTVLTGEVKIDRLGEIHGLALVHNIQFISPSNSLRLAGTQRWGRAVDQVAVGGWQPFEIPVGRILPNYDYTHLVYINDHDPRGAITTTWRNVELCEDASVGGAKATIPPVEGTAADEDFVVAAPYPNPVTDTLHLPGDGYWNLFNMLGSEVANGHGDRVNMARLPVGGYIVFQDGEGYKIVKR